MSNPERARLDMTRPYGEVYGDAGHKYEQDGRKFDHSGFEVVKPGKADEPQQVADEGQAPGAPAAAKKGRGRPKGTAKKATKAKKAKTDLSSLPKDFRPEDDDNAKGPDLRTRYAQVTGGKRAPVGLTNNEIRDMIHKALADDHKDDEMDGPLPVGDGGAE